MLKREGRNRINTSAQNKLWGVKCEQARCIGCAIDTDRSLYPSLSRPVSDRVERKTLLCPAKSKLYNQKTRKIAHPTKNPNVSFSKTKCQQTCSIQNSTPVKSFCKQKCTNFTQKMPNICQTICSQNVLKSSHLIYDCQEKRRKFYRHLMVIRIK